MTSDWKEHQLSDLISIRHGYAYKGKYFSEEKTDDVLITPGNFAIGGGFKEDKLKFYSGPIPEDYVLQEGDLVVTMTDLSKSSDTLGYPAIIPSTPGRRYHHNQRIGLVKIEEPSLIDINYLYFLMRTSDYRHEVLASSTGTSVKHTSPTKILNFKAKIPNLEYQKVIARRLMFIEQKISNNLKMSSSLESIASQIFKSWFIDFEPTKANQKGLPLNGMSPEVQDLFPGEIVDKEGLNTPSGWSIKALYDIAKYVNGAAYKKFEPNKLGNGLPIVKIAELKSGLTEKTAYSTVNMPEKYKLKDRDILFSWSGNPDTSIDTFIWTHGDAYLNQHIFNVIPTDNNNRSFVYLLLRYMRPTFAEIARNKQTTGLGHVTVADLKRLNIILPNKSIMLAFNRAAEPLLERSFLCKKQAKTLQSIQNKLIRQLLGGKKLFKDLVA